MQEKRLLPLTKQSWKALPARESPKQPPECTSQTCNSDVERVHRTVLLFLGCKDAFQEAAQGVEGGVFADPASVAGPTHRRSHSFVVASAEQKMT